MKRPTMARAQPELALVVIARDEASCIERCLLSAKPFVDRMVVLDTGSTDNTAAIASACGAEVHHFAWIDDFSAARNAALEAANADWNLVIDADEWIAGDGEALRAACTLGPLIGLVRVRSQYDMLGATQETNLWIPRLLPRGVRYQGRIHEQPVSSLENVRLPTVFGHDGYLNAKLQKKRGRNTALLLEELAERPNDPYILYQLGKESEIDSGNIAEAADFYSRAFNGVPPGVPYRHDLCIRLLVCLHRSDRSEEAMARAGEWMNEWAESPDFFYVLGFLLCDFAAKHPEQAMEQWLPAAEKAFLRCLEIGDRPKLDFSVQGRGSFEAAQRLSSLYKSRSSALALKASKYFQLSDQLRKRSQLNGEAPATTACSNALPQALA